MNDDRSSDAKDEGPPVVGTTLRALPWLQPQPGRMSGPRLLASTLRRRRKLILAVVVIVTGFVALFVNEATPLYRADATLVITGEQTKSLGIEAAVSGLRPDFYTNQTEAAVLGSWDLASRVVERLRLEENPLYNPALRTPEAGPLDSLLSSIERLVEGNGVFAWMARHLSQLARSAPERTDAALSPAERAKRLHETVTNAYLAGLTVIPEDRSRVIRVRYVSPAPEMAARAVNTTASLYLEQQRAQKSGGTENAAAWLTGRAKELGGRVKADEQKLEAFQRGSAAIPLGSTNLYEQQLARLVEQRSELRLHRDEAKARYDQAQALLISPDLAGSESTALDNPLIQGLRQQETKLQRELAELRSLYREAHPRIRVATGELEDLRVKIRTEITRIVQSLGNDYELAKLREAKLNQEIDRLQTMIQEQREASATRATLESELKSSRALYETMLEQLKATKVDDRRPQEPDARLISQAGVPQAPFYPQRGATIAAAFMVSLMLGVGLALGFEALDRGFRTRSALEAATAIPVLGMVPLVPAAGKRAGSPHRRALLEPNSTYGEAIRALRAALFLARGEARPQAILVTSSVPGEGKTSTALAVATTAAHSGHKTILIECDMLRPALSAAIACPPGPGLGAFLSRQAAIEEVVRIDAESGLHYIVAGNDIVHASDLLASESFRLLVAGLRDFYELIVLDSPPVLAVSDALVVQRLADETVFLVRWQKTPRKIVFAALKTLIEAGGTLAGLVLAQVDMRRHARDEYGSHSGDYYAAYRSYHSDAA